MLCLTGFELYSWRWVPLLKKEEINTMDNAPDKQADFLHPALSRALILLNKWTYEHVISFWPITYAEKMN